MQRQQALDLLRLGSCQDVVIVYGWYLQEIFVSMEASATLLLDNEIRNMVLRHILQAQQYLDNKTERQHLLETRALAIFISNSLVQDFTPLSSSSTPQTQTNNVKSYTEKTTNNTINNTGTTNNGTNIQGITNNTGVNTAGITLGNVMHVLARQQQSIFPFLLMHVSEPAVYSCLETLLKCPFITPELHMTVGRAICAEFLFQCPKVVNGNLIWKVEKIAMLLSTFIETLGNDLQIKSTVASFVDPLSHFILKFTGASFCSEYIFIRLVYLVANKYAESAALRKLVPQFFQAISWNISALMTHLKSEPLVHRQSAESEAKRRVQLQVISLMEVLLQYKKEYYEVVERMAVHQVIDHVCRTVFAPECSPAFNAAGVSFVRAVVAAGCAHLLPTQLVIGFITSLQSSPKKFPHYTVFAKEIYKVPEFSKYFTGDLIEVVHSPVVRKSPRRKTLKQVLTQLPHKEKDMLKCLYHMLSSQDHPYGLVVADFGRKIERSYENGEDMEQVLIETRATLDTFAQSIADSLRDEEIALHVVPFDFDFVCLDACYEAICSREPSIVLSSYHTKFSEKDKALYAMCKKLGSGVTPVEVNVPNKFCLQDTESGKNQVPFYKAIHIFKKFTHKKTPLRKVRVLSDTVRSISAELANAPITADDLMAILIYVILRSKIKTLYSETEFIHDFLAKQHRTGEHGYLVTTLQCCCMYISSPKFIELTENVKLPATM